MTSDIQKKEAIRKIAASLGFDHCGIARAQKLDDDARRLESWLKLGYHAGMQYMENHFDLRIDPSLLVPGARSVITLILNYHPATQQSPDKPQIAKYALGKDYHEVIKEKLKTFLILLREGIGEINGRGFVDSAPVLERSWAVRSGLGWIGKNANLIRKGGGSFYFIATLITDLELPPDDPFVKDHCGNCNKCVEACPTDAILPGAVIDSNRCISYYTIELKEMLIPERLHGKFENWMFGCDTCQDVCPWNRFAKASSESAFTPLPSLLNLSLQEWEEMSKETFDELFRHSPLKRAKYDGIRRNIKFLGNKT
jgi:epoxyqueuosine reductase